MLRHVMSLILLGAALLAPVAGMARPEGLLWAETDLPRVFPLQVRSEAGLDYYVTLRAPGDGHGVLGAYVRGGAFFRVLVPPGRYAVTIISGTDWNAAERRFDRPGATVVDGESLRFSAELAAKRGWLVDLTLGGDETALRPIGLCQRLMMEREVPEAPAPRADDAYRLVPRLAPMQEIYRPEIIERFCG